MRIKKGNNDRCPTIVFFALIILLSITTPASALDLSETYETPPIQEPGTPYSLTNVDGHIEEPFYGIFDSLNPVDYLRVMYGDGGATGIAIMGETVNGIDNQFVQTRSTPVPNENFLGILDHPSWTNRFDNGGPFTLVGDYAALANTPVLISGADISVNVRSNYNIEIRFLFTDLDYEEWVTDNISVTAGNPWSNISVNDLLGSNTLSLLPDSLENGVFSGKITSPVSLEIFLNDSPGASSVLVDFDNFQLTGVTPVPIPSTILLLGFGLIGLGGFRKKFKK